MSGKDRGAVLISRMDKARKRPSEREDRRNLPAFSEACGLVCGIICHGLSPLGGALSEFFFCFFGHASLVVCVFSVQEIWR